jgi:hypothetical protein
MAVAARGQWCRHLRTDWLARVDRHPELVLCIAPTEGYVVVMAEQPSRRPRQDEDRRRPEGDPPEELGAGAGSVAADSVRVPFEPGEADESALGDADRRSTG